MAFRALKFSRPVLFGVLLSALAGAAQYDVAMFGARGDGSTDDTAAIQNAINSIPSGAALDFGGPTKIYLISSRLTLQPNRTYQGQATLLMSSRAPAHTGIAKLAYGSADSITITGLTFDANGVGGGLHIAVDGGTAIPSNRLSLTYMVFRNTIANATGPWDGAIYSPVGLTNSQIAYNQIISCAYGIYLANPNWVTVGDNTFQTVHLGNAISVVLSPAPFAYGQGIQILRNTGQHLGRMAIEMWPNGGNMVQTSQVTAAVISENTFCDWDPGYSADPFGISIVAGQQATIQRNKLTGGSSGVGIEIGAPNSTVSQNTVQGFPTGIILHDSHGSMIDGNFLSQQTSTGIELANSAGSRAGLNITNNRIMNAKSVGIMVNNTDWGGTTIAGNVISRADGAFADDPSGAFTGIGITPPNSPATVSGNSIVQSAPTGPANFSFIGIRVNGGAGENANSVYLNNSVHSNVVLPQSVGIYGNTAGSLEGTVIQGNHFSGLQSVSGGSSSVTVSSGNVVYNCLRTGPITLF
jgi:parallel beta-helix repeat protein